MDIKSKNTSKENINEEEIIVSDKKIKNNKRNILSSNNSKYIIYILTVISLACTFLLGIEIKDNLGYVIPERVYLQTQVANDINDYTSLVEDYSLYYKSASYAKDKDNITQNDIDICKAELLDKANNEYDNYRTSKYNDDSFNSLTYEQQEKILEEQREKIDEKYTLSDEEMNEYILNIKSNSASNLNNKIKSYVNLNFRAYDKLNDVWIGGSEIDSTEIIENSRYFKEINIDYNGNIIEKIYVNGKEIDKNNILGKFIDNYSYSTRFSNYSYENTSIAQLKYDYSEKHNITLYIWMPKELKSGDVVSESFKGVQHNVTSFYLSCITFVIFLVLTIFCLLYLAKYKVKVALIEKIINKVKGYPIEYKIGVGIIGWIIWNIGPHIYYNSNNYIRRLNLSSIIWGSIVVVIY